MERNEIFFTFEKLIGKMEKCNIVNTYEELEYPFSWNFTLMPFVKANKVTESVKCKAKVYTIPKIKNIVYTMCADNKVPRDIFYECIWGLS